eukprot:7982671-Lingulodinium_polyedra.AAC.1
MPGKLWQRFGNSSPCVWQAGSSTPPVSMATRSCARRVSAPLQDQCARRVFAPPQDQRVVRGGPLWVT